MKAYCCDRCKEYYIGQYYWTIVKEHLAIKNYKTTGFPDYRVFNKSNEDKVSSKEIDLCPRCNVAFMEFMDVLVKETEV